MKNKNSNKLENKNKAKKIAIYGIAGLVVATIIVVPTVLITSSKNNNSQSSNAVSYSFNGQNFNTLASAKEAVDKAVNPTNVFTFGNTEYESEAQAWDEAVKTASIDSKTFDDAILPADSDVSLKDFTGKNEASTKTVYTTNVNGKTQTYSSQASAQAAWLLANPNKVSPTGDGSGNNYSQAEVDASTATPAPIGATVGPNTAHVAEVVAVGDGSGNNYTQAQIDARDNAGNLPGTGAVVGPNTAAVANTTSDIPVEGPLAPSYSAWSSSANVHDIVKITTNVSGLGIIVDQNGKYDLSILQSASASGQSTYFVLITETATKLEGAVYSSYQKAHDAWLTFFPNAIEAAGDGSGNNYSQAEVDASTATPAWE